ncbi:hypothetical protein DMN91_008453 [Ooceraea biroi]|uniref:tRNA (guanine(26)-N(2))-dimethyltransferase n=1 Tax=Ooceraea biroi TaxID=2015173 RepID=A0A3L8DHH4_OOCBI|nr:hypothetical protein DMN91_008453 [Ooceraea biroi]
MKRSIIKISQYFAKHCKYFEFKKIMENMDHEQCTKKIKLEETPVISEGKAQILVRDKRVFYNPVQEFNRDLSVAVLTIFTRDRWNEILQRDRERLKEDDENSTLSQKGITILEALSATGLRSIRYAKEVEGVRQIVANDISATAVDSIRQNVLHNGVDNLVIPHHEDATLLMYQRRRDRFDAVDLDPYGSPSKYLDGAVQCVSDGGILLVTATDMAILAGNFPETCRCKYGALSIKAKCCHEVALRILLYCIMSHAERYGRYIVPLLSVSADFYIRVFVQIFTSSKKCKENSSKIGMLYQCVGCESMIHQPLMIKDCNRYKLPSAPMTDRLCKHCQHAQHVAGPIWLGPLHEHGFVSRLLGNLSSMELGTSKRIEGVLTMIHEELDVPLYYNVDRLMSIVKCHVPSMLLFRSALLNAGYKVSYSHASKLSIKTNAPNDAVWDVVRAWEKEHPIKREKLAENSPAARILDASTSTTDISFTIHPHANPISRQKHLSRFQQNPTVNWGPGARSRTRMNLENNVENSKKIRNQNKNSKKRSDLVEKQLVQQETRSLNMAAPVIVFNNGAKIPKLGLGTWQAGDDPKIVEQAVSYAIDAGYRHFDCAYIYENEKEIGKALREQIAKGVVKREELFITTKLWNTFHKRDEVVPACQTSVESFGLGYIDLYLIHWPLSYTVKSICEIRIMECFGSMDKNAAGIIPIDEKGEPMLGCEDYLETWRGMEECVRLGLTRSIGLSNFNSVQIDRVLSIAQIKPVTNQVECHPNLNQKKLREFCAKRDIVITAYSPFGSPSRPWIRPDEPKAPLDAPEILNIATKYGKTPAQVILRYLVDIGTIPIPKSSSRERIKQNINIFDFQLTPQEITLMDSFDCGGRVVHFKQYKAHKDYPFNLEF